MFCFLLKGKRRDETECEKKELRKPGVSSAPFPEVRSEGQAILGPSLEACHFGDGGGSQPEPWLMRSLPGPVRSGLRSCPADLLF